MRIISGYLKGKKILEPLDKNTRPLKDLVKESIFNILSHSNKFQINIDDANILDLFSGTGSFGLEGFSRGAKEVTFVENYRVAINILKENLENLKLINRCRIIQKNILKDLIFENLNQTYDVIFLDPPFNQKEIYLILSKIYQSRILKKKGILILHRKNNYNESFLKEFKILEEKKYGISKIIFGNFI